MAKVTYGLLATGLLLAAGSLIVGWFVFPAVIQSKISQTVRLVENGDTWKKWIDIPIPIYQKFYFWNVTNHQEVQNGAKPVLQEVGPYVYQQKRTKTDIKVNQNDTIFYRQPVFYTFRPDMTEGSPTDKIILPNLPFIGMATKAYRDGGITRSVVQDLFHSEFPDTQLFEEYTVEEFLFTGRYLPFVKSLSESKGAPILPDHTFGIYYKKNGSDPGVMEVYAGVEDSSKFGNIASWNYNSSLPFWGNDSYCNMINGSDGALFPPFVTKDRVLPIFSPDLCRSLYLTFNGEETIRGLTGYRFTLPERLLEDPKTNQDNECFCTYRGGDDFQACPKRGAYQLQSCKKGIPLVVSLPHFLDGSEEMRNKSIGLNPDREKHETVITLEPNTGVLLKAHKRIQMNIEMVPTTKFKKLKKVPEMIFPIFWTDESAQLTEASADRIQSKLIKPQQTVGKAMWGIFGVGCVLLVVGLILLIRQNRRARGEKTFR